MSHRTRSGKAAAASVIPPSKSKKKAISTRMKKSAPTKRHLDSSSTTLTQPRQKRLSSLTAAALVHYCTSVLTPSRKAKRPSQTSTKEDKASLRKRKLSNVSCKSDPKNTQTVSHTRTRREASSRASAMIMQQNEIERSRFNYTLPPAPTATVIRPQRTKTEPLAVPPPPPPQPPPTPPREPFQFNVPSTANLSKASEQTPPSVNLKYPSLTEAILAEHDRLHETLPAYQSTKHEHLVKWTQELALCGRLSPHEITLDSTDDDTRSQSPKPQANAKEISTSSTADSVASHESIPNPTTTPSFLFPSAGYPLDFRSLYPLMPCWQYLGWPYPSTASLLHSASSKKTTPLNFLAKPLVPTHRPHSHSAVPKSKNDALTFHVHTHHHHHIHNSNSLPLLKPSASAKTASLAFSSEKSAPSLPHCKEPPAETKTVLPLSVNNVPRREQPAVPLATETHVLNATAGGKTNANQENGAVRKTTRRKSSPVKRGVNSGTKSQSIFATMANEKISSTADPPIASPRKPAEDQSMATPPIVSDDVNFDAQPAPIEQPVTRRSLKRRSVSAAVVNSNVIVAVTRQSTRGSRTISASCIPSRSKSSRSRKRTHSATSVASASSNKRKRAKISHHWALCGRASQQLVSLHADKPPVFRDCYASIRHITEKDVIKSGDCIILQPDAGRRNGATPYLAKVKWFWQEPKSDEILMSLIWYYHPEHTELPARVKQRFLPNELLASRYADCVNVACIEDKCYVLNLNEYNRYCLREASPTLFDHSEGVGQLKVLLNKNTSTVHHRPLPGKTVGTQNIFFCRYVYDYRVKRISKNPSLANPATANT